MTRDEAHLHDLCRCLAAAGRLRRSDGQLDRQSLGRFVRIGSADLDGGVNGMENDTPLLNSDRKVQMGCFAALPGTGPVGQICSHCSMLDPAGSKFVCAKYKVLSGRQGKPISPNSAACRYFQQRPAFNAREP